MECNLGRSVQPHGSITIIGIGGLGILGIQFTRALEYQTAAVDHSAKGLKLAANLPVSSRPNVIVDFGIPEADKKLTEMTDSTGRDAVIVCNDTAVVADWALKMVRPEVLLCRWVSQRANIPRRRLESRLFSTCVSGDCSGTLFTQQQRRDGKADKNGG